MNNKFFFLLFMLISCSKSTIEQSKDYFYSFNSKQKIKGNLVVNKIFIGQNKRELQHLFKNDNILKTKNCFSLLDGYCTYEFKNIDSWIYESIDTTFYDGLLIQGRLHIKDSLERIKKERRR